MPHIHDPGHVALRRGVRAAIGVPITSALALVILPDSPAGIVAAFGSLCLIALCDFGGALRRRLVSLLGAGLVGAVLIIIGVLASQNTVAAVVTTLVVGSALALSPVLRGSIGSAAQAMTIMYVVAITAGIPADQVGKPVIAWALALVVAIPLTLWVLPRRNLAPVRHACAQAVLAFADAVDARPRGESPDADALTAAQDALRRSYLGNPFRAAGLNHTDRALIALAGQMQGLLATVAHGRAYPTPAPTDANTTALIESSAAALRQAGDALLAPGPQPTGVDVFRIWHAQWPDAVGVMADTRRRHAWQRVDEVAALFPDRAMAVAAIRVVMLTRTVLGLHEEAYPSGPGVPSIPAPTVSTGRQDVRAQLSLHSPWARVALRTGVGLAIAVLVVQLTGLAHGLWVVLGVTSVLRFDGLTTARTAVQSLVGTFVGAAIGFAILTVDFSHIGWLWAMLVGATFLAVWVQGAVGFATGQAAFSVFVISAYTAMTWPPDLGTATDRIEDVAVGAAVSIVVAFLLWPGGVLRGSIAHVATAIRATMAALHESATSLVDGPGVATASLSRATVAVQRAQEVVELSLSSPRPDAAVIAYQWQAVLDHLRTPTVVALMLGAWAPNHGPIAETIPGVRAPLMAELDAVVSQWEALADDVEGSARRGEPSVFAYDAAEMSTVVEEADATQSIVADRLVAAVWTQGWLRMCLHAARSCDPPASETGRLTRERSAALQPLT